MQRVSSATWSRGCGARQAGGSYLCTALSPHGRPLEEFLIDPVKAMDLEPFRAPILFDDPQRDGVKHVLVWVGAEHYPSPADFIEEVRRRGASRRIPTGFDLSQLTPGMSRMVLIHPKAATTLIEPPAKCPKGIHGDDLTEPCLGAHYHYVGALGSRVIAQTETDVQVQTGDTVYTAPVQRTVDPKAFTPGAFLQLPITHVEYQARSAKDEGPAPLTQYEAQGWDVQIIDDPAVYTGGES